MKNTSKEPYYERLRNLANVSKTSIKETQSRTLGTLIDYKRAADGVAYGIIKENHNYYLKKGGTKRDPDVSDFAYIGGLSNITNFQYKSLGDADKNRNMIMHTIGEASTTKVNPNGSKKMLHEDLAGQEIDNAESMLGDLNRAKKPAPEDDGQAEMQAGLGAEPAGPEEMPAAPAPEAGVEGGEMPAEPAPEGGAPEDELPEPELGDAEGGAPEDEIADDAETTDADALTAEEPVRELEKNIGKLTNKIRKTDLEPEMSKSFLKSLIQSFKDKLPELEIEDRKEIANLLLKIVPPEDVADLSNDMPPEESEDGLEEGGCSECGTFAKYAESMGYGSADALMECGEEGVANLVSNYANHAADGQNDGDAEGVALVIKLVNPNMLNTIKNDYGHEDYANQIEPMVNSMQESTQEECYGKVQEMFGGQTDPANVQTQPIVEEDEEEGEDLSGEDMDDDDLGSVGIEEPEEIKFGGAQSLGGGVMKPDGAPTTISVTSQNGTNVEVSLNEVLKKLKQVVAESKKINETKFTAHFNGKKISIEGTSLLDAKQKAIKQLNVPKSKEGLLSVVSDKSQENGDFKFNEAKKPSAELSKEKKSEVVKKAKAGEDIGKKGKGFEKVATKAAEKYGSKEKGEKVAAAAMWKGIKKEGVEPEAEVMTESERKIRAYVRKRLEEQAGLRKPSLNESSKSVTLKKLDEMIDKQFGLYESVVKKKVNKGNVNELFGFGDKTETPEQTELMNKIKEMTQKMTTVDQNLVVFNGGSPEKQIEILTKAATDNNFRGDIKYQKSPADDRVYLVYTPEKSTFQKAIAPSSAGMSIMGNS